MPNFPSLPLEGEVAKLMTNPTDPFLHNLGNTAAKLPLGDVPWLSSMRSRAKDNYIALGLPTSKLEAWKYTSLKELNKLDFSPSRSLAANDSVALPSPLPSLDCYRFVLFNGQYSKSLSSHANLPKGVIVSSLADIMQTKPEWLKDIIGSLRSDKNDAMSALNSAHLVDGLFVTVSEDVILDKPIHLISYAVNEEQKPVVFHPRHIIQIGSGASATLIESHVGVGNNTLSNSLSEIWVEKGARLGHFKNQSENHGAYHLASTNVRVTDNAIYNNFTLQIGGKIARNEVSCEIAGSFAEAHVNGAYFGTENQHIDNTSFIDHAVPSSNSFETFKGVLDDSASAVFQGKILVRKDAQKTDGQQMSRALLLSRKAEVNAKPELEIYADDVKCSHGATVGELDNAQLFYLMARGISEDTARNLLVRAFLFEVLDKIPDENIKQAFHDVIAAKLEKAAS